MIGSFSRFMAVSNGVTLISPHGAGRDLDHVGRKAVQLNGRRTAAGHKLLLPTYGHCIYLSAIKHEHMFDLSVSMN